MKNLSIIPILLIVLCSGCQIPLTEEKVSPNAHTQELKKKGIFGEWYCENNGLEYKIFMYRKDGFSIEIITSGVTESRKHFELYREEGIEFWVKSDDNKGFVVKSDNELGFLRGGETWMTCNCNWLDRKMMDGE